eukprot:10441773-Alexandrium_andersonii.AAC.1
MGAHHQPSSFPSPPDSLHQLLLQRLHLQLVASAMAASAAAPPFVVGAGAHALARGRVGVWAWGRA